MAGKEIVHIVAQSSADRAELARVVFSLGYHAEIYADYQELLTTRPSRGVVIAEDIPPQGGVVMFIEAMSTLGFWRPVIATSSTVDVRRVVAAVRAGACDYLGPDLEASVVQHAVEAAVLDAEDRGAARREAVEAQDALSRLSHRELEVLDHLVAGSSNKEIARRMEISPRTVEIHRANMMTKLGANHPADAIRCRLAAGSISEPLRRVIS